MKKFTYRGRPLTKEEVRESLEQTAQRRRDLADKLRQTKDPLTEDERYFIADTLTDAFGSNYVEEKTT